MHPQHMYAESLTVGQYVRFPYGSGPLPYPYKGFERVVSIVRNDQFHTTLTSASGKVMRRVHNATLLQFFPADRG